jgi:hypothetical protein
MKQIKNLNVKDDKDRAVDVRHSLPIEYVHM